MRLTQQIIRDTLSPDNGRITLTDGRGLQLRITSSGKRTWSLQYRFNGRMLKTTIGEWPAVSVSDARKLADAERLKLAQGVDPQTEKKNAKTKGLSFQAAWEMFDALYIAEKKPKTAKEYRRSKINEFTQEIIINPDAQKELMSDFEKNCNILRREQEIIQEKTKEHNT